jgi:hypothetical protein
MTGLQYSINKPGGGKPDMDEAKLLELLCFEGYYGSIGSNP